METITLGQLLEAVGGTLLGEYDRLDTPILRVETDSRTIHSGSLFIPLVGERFDGHDYAAKAVAAGAPRPVLCQGVRHPAGSAGSGGLVQGPV